MRDRAHPGGRAVTVRAAPGPSFLAATVCAHGGFDKQPRTDGPGSLPPAVEHGKNRTCSTAAFRYLEPGGSHDGTALGLVRVAMGRYRRASAPGALRRAGRGARAAPAPPTHAGLADGVVRVGASGERTRAEPGARPRAAAIAARDSLGSVGDSSAVSAAVALRGYGSEGHAHPGAHPGLVQPATTSRTESRRDVRTVGSARRRPASSNPERDADPDGGGMAGAQQYAASGGSVATAAAGRARAEASAVFQHSSRPSSRAAARFATAHARPAGAGGASAGRRAAHSPACPGSAGADTRARGITGGRKPRANRRYLLRQRHFERAASAELPSEGRRATSARRCSEPGEGP